MHKKTLGIVLIAIGLSLAAIFAFVAPPQGSLENPQMGGLLSSGKLWIQESLLQDNSPQILVKSTSASEEDPGVQHSRIQLTLGLLATLWGWIVLIVIVFGGFSPRLRDLARKMTGGRLGFLIPYVVVLSVLRSILGLPFSFYSGYVVEHQFGLSNQDVGAWLGDFLKSWGMGIVLNIIILSVAYYILRRSPRRWWLYGAAVAVVFSVVLTTLAPVLFTPIFNKFEPLQDQELKSQIMDLTKRGGVQIADVLQADMSRQTNAVNAYFNGLGPTKQIVLYDTLLAKFSHEEVLVVVAHEMGHQVHEDIWRSIGAGAIVFFVGFYLLYRVAGPLVRRFQKRFGFARLDDPASLPLLLLLVGLLLFLIGPIENTFSRYVEHEADRYALDLTHENDVWITAMEKMGKVNVSDPDPPPWIEFMFYTHPSEKHRIEFAETYHPWEE